MATGKDHGDVICFMSGYQRLRDMIDDDPGGLEKLLANDDLLKNLCVEIGEVALRLSLAERAHRQAFAAPVDPEFIRAWRDYEERYSFKIASVVLADMLNLQPSPVIGAKSRFDFHIENAAAEGREWASEIESVFEFAQEQVEAERQFSEFSEDLADKIEAGIEKWRRLSTDTGFRVEDVVRRRNLVPFTLVPRHVSDRHGSQEKLSLLTHLQQTQEAFVFGVPFAALALMRSILEILLKEHYSSNGDDLGHLINNAKRLPRIVERDKLHGLRKLANEILHFERGRIELPVDMETQIVVYLFILRALIEAAPGTSRIGRQ